PVVDGWFYGFSERKFQLCPGDFAGRRGSSIPASPESGPGSIEWRLRIWVWGAHVRGSRVRQARHGSELEFGIPKAACYRPDPEHGLRENARDAAALESGENQQSKSEVLFARDGSESGHQQSHSDYAGDQSAVCRFLR